MLKLDKISASIDEKSILSDVSLTINTGETHVIMGPNGAGKSTLASLIMGSPRITIDSGKILFLGEDITDASSEKRAAMGLFLAFQYPREIAGVQLERFLQAAVNTVRKAQKKDEYPILGFKKKLQEEMEILQIKPEFAGRSLNEGFSGGEKKKAEMLQLGMLEPKLAVLDETDSGLDVDALRIVADAINRFSSKENAVLLVTHYQRFLDHITPDKVHIMSNGTIIKTGGAELSDQIEKEGFEQFSQ